MTAHRACALAVTALAATAAGAALEPAQILILVNRDTPISSQVGRMYQKAARNPSGKHPQSFARHRASHHAGTVLVEGGSADIKQL